MFCRLVHEICISIERLALGEYEQPMVSSIICEINLAK